MKEPWLKLNQDPAGDGGATGTEGADPAAAPAHDAEAMNKAMLGWQTRTIKKVTEMVKGELSSLPTMDDFKSMLSEIGNGGQQQQQQPQLQDGANQKPEAKAAHPVLETSTDVQLAKLQAELETERKKREETDVKLAQKDEAIDLEKFHGVCEEALVKSGARSDLQRQARVAMLTDAKIHIDDEKGRQFEMETQYGPEFVDQNKFAENWLKENAHFLEATKRGSGVGGGNSAGGVPGEEIDIKKLVADPDEFLKNPEKFRKKFEQQFSGSKKL